MSLSLTSPFLARWTVVQTHPLYRERGQQSGYNPVDSQKRCGLPTQNQLLHIASNPSTIDKVISDRCSISDAAT
ncbi:MULTISPECIES: hypothetical protein [unclassified Coleofasciculus]|uniref:hypothetical protein n=1 Tax=unclassified Coleofasciculus TaxID=2692782 RepID=UPI0018822BEB|nr:MULTISPECIES: hypothetical protein [unclassified Coleofasciculus]MBE9127277.1 hypothetical protein [Coleofasciculus sp. LEGE 07081]MBE9150571.1 hypothetical protein [Coleofasciculus sp. LEGE 07092]